MAPGREQADAERVPADAERGPADAEQGPGDAEQGPGDAEQGPGDAEQGPGDAERVPGDAERAELEDERDFCLRSIRDLDAEYEAGDLDEGDYQRLRDAYTARTAAVLRALAGELPRECSGPTGDDAEPASTVAGAGEATPPGAPTGRPRRSAPRRRRRVLVAGGIALAAVIAGWAVASSSGTRLPGEPVSGQSLGADTAAKYLAAAQAASDKGDYLTAVKDYQKVLDSQPEQPEALTGEGWVLAETQQPALLKEGLGLLSSAETAAPDYAPAHVYRGIALLSEGDYAGAVPELRWYLAHHPDPRLEPRVRQALQEAEAKAAAEGPAPTAVTTPAG